MAIDTAAKRFSMMRLHGGFCAVPLPDGTIDAGDRIALLYLYSGIAVGGPVGPLPIGTVPVRYILSGETANVVPVETVFVWSIGVVYVREFVGPANVVPVREVPGETPRVKVMKV